MRLIWTVLLLAAASPSVAEQEHAATPLEESRQGRAERNPKPLRYKSNANVHFATGICRHFYLHAGVGGGAEAFVWKGLAIGASASYHKFVSDIGFGLVSPNVAYHFTGRDQPRRIDPFVRFSPPGAVFTGNSFSVSMGLGGGLNYWLKQKVGLRTEVDFQVLPDDEALLIFRVGISFR